MTGDLDRLDRAIVNAFQGGFPVVAEPFEPAAAALTEAGVDCDPTTLRDRIRRLDDEGYLSRFGPLINADEIGGKTTLVAMAVPGERFDEVAARVNERTEVAHNYERDHDLNMWFVLSVARPDRIEEVLADIEAETGLTTYSLPKRREFHLQATFPVDGPLQDGLDLSHLGPTVGPGASPGISRRETALIEAVQDGLPLTATPYETVGDRIDEDGSWVRETMARFRDEGKIRRIGVVPHHYSLGYTENAMTVWAVAPEDVEAVGRRVGALPFVTHCYERPRYDVWPYTLFAMVHGRNEAECQERIAGVEETIRDALDGDEVDWDVLYSTEVLKKTGIRLSKRASHADS